MPNIPDGTPSERYESIVRKILSARGESAILLNVFGIKDRLAVGLTNSQQRSLILAAAWRWARVNTRILAGNPNTHCVIACGHDLAEIFKGFPGFTRLDFERIAVDAFHALPPKAFKRRRSAYGCRRR
jgi:hypothetical protein